MNKMGKKLILYYGKKATETKKTREVLHPFIKTEIENSTGKPT